MSVTSKQTALKFSDPQVEFVDITPDMAFAWITGRNLKNRPLKEGVIERYIKDMVSDAWETNGESIKFDTRDVLLDGQHRLHAIHRSKKTVRIPVFTGLDPQVFHTMDIGCPRSAADVFHVKGEMNANTLSAALRLLNSFDESSGSRIVTIQKRNQSISIIDLETTLNKHPGIRQSISMMRPFATTFFITQTQAAVLHYLFSKSDAQRADIFFDRLLYGSELSAKHPILLLRNILIEMRDLKKRRMPIQVMALCVKAWNAYLNDEPIAGLRYNNNEPFPLIQKAKKPQ